MGRIPGIHDDRKRRGLDRIRGPVTTGEPRKGHTWIRKRLLTPLEGVGPNCAGPTDTISHVCNRHDVAAGEISDACGSRYEVHLLHVCDVCKFDWWLSLGLHVVPSMAGQVFFHDHEIDRPRTLDEDSNSSLYRTVETPDRSVLQALASENREAFTRRPESLRI